MFLGPLPGRFRVGNNDPMVKKVGMSMYGRFGGVPFVLAMVCLVVAACAPLPPVPAPPPFTIPPARLTGHQLLVVREADGNLAVVDPATGERVQLTDDASATVVHGQPVWSPAAAELAWVRSELEGTRASGQVLVADTAGTVRLRVATVFPPFYMYWNPQGTRLSLLGNWMVDGRPTMAMSVIDMGDSGDGTARIVDVGAPFYYDWAPDGERMLVHRNATTVWVGSPEQPQPVTDSSSAFASPAWLPDSESIVYGDLRDGVATLVRADLDTREEEVVTWYQGSHLAVYPDPTGDRLAVIETSDMVPVNAFGPLYLYSLKPATLEQLTTLPVMAAFWSPDGTRLLYWEGDLSGRPGDFNLRIWSEDGIREVGSAHSPPDFLQRYLYFSDQYARSHTLWSADSRWIAFAAEGPSGQNEIRIQEVGSLASPPQVLAGDLVFWSRHTHPD